MLWNNLEVEYGMWRRHVEEECRGECFGRVQKWNVKEGCKEECREGMRVGMWKRNVKVRCEGQLLWK